MQYKERESGVIVAATKPEQPTEHPVRKVIRDSLASMADGLGEFQQTTHGLLTDGSADAVARRLVDCYENPSGYTISSLYQVIRDMVNRDADFTPHPLFTKPS